MSSSFPSDEDTTMDWEEDVPAARQVGGYVVLDTNIVISHYAWIKASCGIIWGPGSETLPSNMGMIVFAIPWTVLRELDKLKMTKGATNPELAANVRRANRVLFEMLSRRDGSITGQKRWEKTELGNDPGAVNDDKILDYCLYLSDKTKLRVALISNDTNLLAKTSVYGITALDWDSVVKSSGPKIMENTQRIEKEYRYPQKGEPGPLSQTPGFQQEQKPKSSQGQGHKHKDKSSQPQGQAPEKPQKPTSMSVERNTKRKGSGTSQNSADGIVANISPNWDSIIRPNQASSPVLTQNSPLNVGMIQQNQIQPFNQQNQLQPISIMFSQQSQAGQLQLYSNSSPPPQNQLQPFGNSLAQQSQMNTFQPFSNTTIQPTQSNQIQLFNNGPTQQIQPSNSSFMQPSQMNSFNLFGTESNALTQQQNQLQLTNPSNSTVFQSNQISPFNIYTTEDTPHTPTYVEGPQNGSSSSFMQFQASQEMSATKTQSSAGRTTTQSLKKKQEAKFTATISKNNSGHSKKFTKAATEVKKAQKVESSTSEFSRKNTVVTHTKEVKKIVTTTIKTQESIIDLISENKEKEKEKEKEVEEVKPKKKLVIIRPEKKKKEEEVEEVKLKKKLTIIRPNKDASNFTKKFEILIASFVRNVSDIVVEELNSSCLKGVNI